MGISKVFETFNFLLSVGAKKLANKVGATLLDLAMQEKYGLKVRLLAANETHFDLIEVGVPLEGLPRYWKGILIPRPILSSTIVNKVLMKNQHFECRYEILNSAFYQKRSNLQKRNDEDRFVGKFFEEFSFDEEKFPESPSGILNDGQEELVLTEWELERRFPEQLITRKEKALKRVAPSEFDEIQDRLEK